MKIKKTFQGEIPENKIMNDYTDTTTDTYSCEYINGLNVYSSSETIIGYWGNNRTPVYRKVFYTETTGTDVNINHNISNLGNVINIGGNLTRYSDGFIFPWGQKTASDWCGIYLTSTQIRMRTNYSSNSARLVILEYTKNEASTTSLEDEL